MKGIIDRLLNQTLWTWLVPVLLLIAMTPRDAVGTGFGEDLEKPRPEFTREGDIITAKLIPRAKTTSILIHFQVSEGHLTGVDGMDFEEAEHPDVDHKDFKSVLFVVKVDGIAPGGETKVSITSNFFTGSTEYWIFNRNLTAPWANSEAENISHPDLVQELVIRIKDGGPLDADGVVDGQIALIGGPKDSFWGYALGTLFIRFFGIFMVLGILMIGMILSGKVFQRLDKKAAEVEKTFEPQFVSVAEDIESVGLEKDVSPELATAVSLALHLHFSALEPPESVCFFTPEITPWARQGRERIMNARFLTFNRGNRMQNG